MSTETDSSHVDGGVSPPKTLYDVLCRLAPGETLKPSILTTNFADGDRTDRKPGVLPQSANLQSQLEDKDIGVREAFGLGSLS